MSKHAFGRQRPCLDHLDHAISILARVSILKPTPHHTRHKGESGGGLSGPSMFDGDFRRAFMDWLVRERGKTGKSAQEYFYQLGDVTRVIN